MAENISKQITSLIETNAPKAHELVYGEGEDQLTIKVNPVLTLTQRAMMVTEIVNGVFMEDRDTIDTYHPELLEFMQKYTTLKFFTDFQMPSNVEDLWIVLEYTPICDDVAEVVGKDLREIFIAADKAIDVRKEYIANSNDLNVMMKKIGDAVKGLESKISKDDVSKALKGLEGLASGNTADIMKLFGAATA